MEEITDKTFLCIWPVPVRSQEALPEEPGDGTEWRNQVSTGWDAMASQSRGATNNQR